MSVTRRSFTPLAAAAFLPPDSTPASLQSEFAFEAVVDIGPGVEVGHTPAGVRRYIPITGGSFSGLRIRGTVLAGGADWQLQRTDGVLEVDALYSIKASDSTVIIVHNQGLIAPGNYTRTVPRFQAPEGEHAWLNKSIFLGSISGAPHPSAVTIRVFRVI